MPPLTKSFLDKLQLNKLYPIFIESGTFKGETIFNLEQYFEQLHTIEISSKYYNDTKNSYNGNKITFHLGDSSNFSFR